MSVNLHLKINKSCDNLFFLKFIKLEYYKDDNIIILKMPSMFSYKLLIKSHNGCNIQIVDDDFPCDFPLIYSAQRIKNIVNNYKNYAKRQLAITYQINYDKLSEECRKIVEQVLDSF